MEFYGKWKEIISDNNMNIFTLRCKYKTWIKSKNEFKIFRKPPLCAWNVSDTDEEKLLGKFSAKNEKNWKNTILKSGQYEEFEKKVDRMAK